MAFIENAPACNPSGIAFDASGDLYIADAAQGEVNAGAGSLRGKIACMDQELVIPGLPLPMR